MRQIHQVVCQLPNSIWGGGMGGSKEMYIYIYIYMYMYICIEIYVHIYMYAYHAFPKALLKCPMLTAPRPNLFVLAGLSGCLCFRLRM